jgi:hypothetical protein
MQIKLLLVSVCFSLSSFGQVSIFNESLTDSTVDYFYIGVLNQVRISGIPKAERTITIAGTGATIQSIGFDNYAVSVNAVTDDCILSVYRKNKLVATRIYKVRTVPPPEARIGQVKNGDKVTREELLSNTKVNIVFPGCYLKLDLKVLSYQLIIGVERDNDIFIRTNTTDQFSNAQRDFIRRCNPGDRIIMDNIIAVSNNMDNIYLKSVMVTIKKPE